MLAKMAERASVDVEYTRLRAMELSMIKERAFILNYKVKDQTLDLWCVEYRTRLAGGVASAEFFNHLDNGAVLLPKDVSYDFAKQCS